jgi:hypothetical protein
LQHAREDAFERPFLLACTASLCQNTSTYADEAPLMKLGRNGWWVAQGSTINWTKTVPDTCNSLNTTTAHPPADVMTTDNKAVFVALIFLISSDARVH